MRTSVTTTDPATRAGTSASADGSQPAVSVPPELVAKPVRIGVATNGGGSTSTHPGSGPTADPSVLPGAACWANLNDGKLLPGPNEWRALEQRASSFRLR
ncbi:MAG: hypothetical protein RLZZ238_1041 [Planctomycetota bacterium]